jgi:glycerol uptake facilitator-like aquaporin
VVGAAPMAELLADDVGLHVTDAYWFTSSISFSNPAVALARSFSEAFAGTAQGHVSAFIAVQVAAAAVATVLLCWLLVAEDDPGR